MGAGSVVAVVVGVLVLFLGLLVASPYIGTAMEVKTTNSLKQEPFDGPEFDYLPLTRPSLDSLNKLEKKRWDGNEELSFPGAKRVKEIRYSPMSYDTDKIMESTVPVLIKGSPAVAWPAMERWSSPDRFEALFPKSFVHCPSHPQVRLHSPDKTMNPLGDLANVTWSHLPWIERTVATRRFFDEPEKMMYFMINTLKVPDELIYDVQDLSYAMVPWSPPLEVNLWMGTPYVTTPAHYDMVHNFYTQVVGKKRWIMFTPDQHFALHVFPSVHPSDRMSQIDINDPQHLNSSSPFSNDLKSLKAYEVVLEAGDVLYIPPFVFHYVAAVGEGPSISISTHTDSHASSTRVRSLQRMEYLFDRFFEQNPRFVISESLRAKLVARHIVDLFGSQEKAVSQTRRLFESRWSHLSLDKSVIGLQETLQEINKDFPDQKIKEVVLKEEDLKWSAETARSVLEKFKDVSDIHLEILLLNHVEMTINHVLSCTRIPKIIDNLSLFL